MSGLSELSLCVQMLEVGKQHHGPHVDIWFKICEAGSTDWVGWILGARAIDCTERGGLGFIPMSNSYSFTTLGIQTRRIEPPGGPRLDSCYAIRRSVLDSDDESGSEQLSEPRQRPVASAAALSAEDAVPGIPLLYEGDPITLSQGTGAWVPVVAAMISGTEPADTETQIVLPAADSPVEVVPGIWGTGDEQGIVCVVGNDEFDTALEPGTKVAEILPAAVQTRVCQHCWCVDTDGWITSGPSPTCTDCGAALVKGPMPCAQCGADEKEGFAMSYAGCATCKPERRMPSRIRRGPGVGLIAGAALAFAALCVASDPAGQSNAPRSVQLSEPRQGPAASAGSQGVAHEAPKAQNVKLHPVFHIVRSRAGFDT